MTGKGTAPWRLADRRRQRGVQLTDRGSLVRTSGWMWLRIQRSTGFWVYLKQSTHGTQPLEHCLLMRSMSPAIERRRS